MHRNYLKKCNFLWNTVLPWYCTKFLKKNVFCSGARVFGLFNCRQFGLLIWVLVTGTIALAPNIVSRINKEWFSSSFCHKVSFLVNRVVHFARCDAFINCRLTHRVTWTSLFTNKLFENTMTWVFSVDVEVRPVLGKLLVKVSPDVNLVNHLKHWWISKRLSKVFSCFCEVLLNDAVLRNLRFLHRCKSNPFLVYVLT